MKSSRAVAAGFLALASLAGSRMEGADLVFGLDFEKGLKTEGVGAVAVTEQGGGLAASSEGHAWQFDGKAALEAVSGNPSALAFGATESFTLEAKVRLDSATTSGAIFSKGSGANYRLSVDAKHILSLSYYSKGSWRGITASGYPIPTGEWTPVVAQYNGAGQTVTLLVGGKLAARVEIEAPLQSKDTLPLYIGGSINPTLGEPRGILGALDEIRVYSGLQYPEAENAEPGATVAR